MTAVKSTGLANHIAVTGSIKAAMDGMFLYLYNGPIPETADEAIDASSVELVMISNNSDGVTGLTFDGTPVDGVLKKTAAEVWSGLVSATGTATFFRAAATDPSGASSTDKRLQGSVGESVLDDVVLTSATLASGDTRRIDQFQIY